MSALPPEASSAAVRARMRAQPRRDTGCELAVRSALHRRGLRYFVHRRPVPALRREADVVFPRARVAVFVDGCYWHGCQEHGDSGGHANDAWWLAKFARTAARDADTDLRLAKAGWTVVRIWEHEAPEAAADRVETAVRQQANDQRLLGDSVALQVG